jgi:hypothetical protein
MNLRYTTALHHYLLFRPQLTKRDSVSEVIPPPLMRDFLQKGDNFGGKTPTPAEAGLPPKGGLKL